MDATTPAYKTIDEYIALYPKPVQQVLESVRETIRAAAPGAVECISYRIPTFKLKRNLVHFAAYENHIGFYPGAEGVAAFAAAVKNYKTAKGTIQFPLDAAMPLDLIRDITLFRVKQEEERVGKKNTNK